MKRVIQGCLAWLCLCLAALNASPVLASDPVDEESLLKAAFIVNFVKFTRWPVDAWGDQNSALVLCTAGSDGLTDGLVHLSNETIKGRPVVIRSVALGRETADCHVLYVSGSEYKIFRRWIEQTRATPVLTISEIRGFADAGGVIQLFQARNRIRFRISLDAANEKNLKLSVRLLDLAEVIDSGVAK